jgi:hypothetical protein
MPIKKVLSCIFLSLCIIIQLHAAEFEGNMTIVKQTLYDTTIFKFSVQNQFVRIDQFSSKKVIIQTLIIDLNTEKITALSPTLKLYTNIQKQKNFTKNSSEIKVIPSEEYKIINGYKCFLWRVRNESRNSETSYWVYNSGYSFFQKTINLLNRTSDYSNLFENYSSIENYGMIPVLSIERTLLREEKSKILLNDIKHQKVNPAIFKIPNNYKFLRY